MQSIHHFSRILNSINSVNGEILALQNVYKELEAITEVDKGFIDSFNASASAMIAAATALKDVAYDPSPAES